jgi:hypothetical protein
MALFSDAHINQWDNADWLKPTYFPACN